MRALRGDRSGSRLVTRRRHWHLALEQGREVRAAMGGGGLGGRDGGGVRDQGGHGAVSGDGLHQTHWGLRGEGIRAAIDIAEGDGG